ncbi:MAG: phosphotransferase [Pseudomonadales bacterium]|nr:phosphotransferase family protein [Pseudomonadales bacterium]NIX06836.1 phosphotransferase [Pseudomonadales bacterium]
MDHAEFEARLGEVLAQRLERVRSLRSVERLSGGASQETYRLTVETADGEELMAMRRAPGGGLDVEVAPPTLATEALLMRSARAVGVPEPEVYHVLEPEDGLGEGFVMEWLEGEALGARIVRSPELDGMRPQLAYECGRVMAKIHAIDLDRAGLRDRLETLTPEELLHRSWDRYKDFATPQPMIDYTARWLLDNMPETFDMALVHNDFRNGNFMVDANGIVAVLDWEVAHIGDPMRDLGWICTNSWRFGRSDRPVGGFGEYADLFRGYEDESGVAVDPERVKFWEVMGSFWWAVGCLGMAEHYRTGPDKTVERPAIGRRSSECQVDCVNLIIPGDVELVEGTDLTDCTDMPRVDELLVSVRDYLRADVMAATSGRTNFLARVAGNSLDIVLRELAIGTEARSREQARLEALLGRSDDLDVLRWELVEHLRSGELKLDDAALTHHLRTTVVNQIAIDQPRYSGYKIALASAGIEVP